MKQIRESPDDLSVRWGHQLSTSSHAQWPEVDSLTDNLDIMDFIIATQFCCCKVDVFIRKIEVRDDMDVLNIWWWNLLKSLAILMCMMSEVMGIKDDQIGQSEKVLMTFKWDQLVWGHQLSTSGHVSGHAWWYENIYLFVNMIAWLVSLMEGQ